MLQYPLCESSQEFTQKFVEEVKRLAERDRLLRRVKIHTTVVENNLMVVVVNRGEAGVLIGRRGKVARTLERKLKKKIRFVEAPYDIYSIAVSILKPARVLGINRLFLPGGEEKLKIRLAKWDLLKLPSDIPSLERVLKRFMGKDVQLYFE